MACHARKAMPGRAARPARDPAALRSAVAACPHTLLRGDAPDLVSSLLSELDIATGPGGDTPIRRRGNGELGDGASFGPGRETAQAQQADTGKHGGEKCGQVRPPSRTIHVASSLVSCTTHRCHESVSSSFLQGGVWAACRARKASPARCSAAAGPHPRIVSRGLGGDAPVLLCSLLVFRPPFSRSVQLVRLGSQSAAGRTHPRQLWAC
jgi:hypothetical protein